LLGCWCSCWHCYYWSSGCVHLYR